MRFFGIAAVVATTLTLGACGGSKDNAADTAAVATPTTDSASTTPAASATATPAATTGAAVAPAPITGTTHDIKMVSDAKGYHFDPTSITIKQGDGLKFINVSGGPHNVAFDPATLPADVKAQLAANMPNAASELSSPMLVNPNDSYTISFANVKPGTYQIHCTPHLALGMTMQVTVQ